MKWVLVCVINIICVVKKYEKELNNLICVEKKCVSMTYCVVNIRCVVNNCENELNKLCVV